MRSSLRFILFSALSLLAVILTLLGSIRLTTHAVGTSLKSPTQSHVSSATPACGAWSVVSSPNAGYLEGVAVVSKNDVWAVGLSNGQTLTEQWNGSSWTIIPSPNGGTGSNALLGVTAISATNIWAVGYQINNGISQTLIEQGNGTSWTIIPSPNLGTGSNSLQAITRVPRSNNLWAVGNYNSNSGTQPLVEEWNGSNWMIIPSPNVGTNGALYAVTALSAKNVWAVGYQFNGMTQTLTEQWNGTSWTIIAGPTPQASNESELFGEGQVRGSSVWAVGSYYNSSSGNQTLTEQQSKGNWSIIPSPNLGSGVANGGDGDLLLAVAGVSTKNIWAVGFYQNNNAAVFQQTLIEHWNGRSWSTISSPNTGKTDNELVAVAAVPGSSQVWSVGFSIDTPNSPAQTLIEFYC